MIRKVPAAPGLFRQLGSAVTKRLLRHYRTVMLVLSITLLALGTLQQHLNLTPTLPLYGGRGVVQQADTDDGWGTDQLGISACPILPEELGLVGEVPVNLTAPTWEELDNMYPNVASGGRWRPTDCVARSRVVIVIPYRNRDYNLRAFLAHMHGFLQRQKLQYSIFVAEQAGNTTFNRGIMRNIGYMEANLNHEFDCTIFNDVDLLPENDMNSYGCPDLPRHMCIALDYFDYKPIASGAIFGGIVAFRNDHFRRVNGYSNLYFGWGGEDDDLMARCKKTGVGYYRARPQHGRYKGTPHQKDHRIGTTYKLWRYRDGRAQVDGLNSLRYKVLSREKRKLYSWVLTAVDEEGYGEESAVYLKYMDELAKNATKAKQAAEKQAADATNNTSHIVVKGKSSAKQKKDKNIKQTKDNKQAKARR